jgi:four helix bundle protein
MAKFDPDRIAAYRLAREHTREVHKLIARAKTRGHADLIKQYRKAAASVSANILEGIGDARPAKRLNYFMVAKGSAYESWAHTDSLLDLGLVQESAIQPVRNIQNQIAAVLITSIRNLEAELVDRPGHSSVPSEFEP